VARLGNDKDHMKKSRLLAVSLSALVAMWTIHFAAIHIQQFGTIKGHTIAATEGPSALIRSLRPNYPYSIIAGGAYSPGELRFAHGKDAVVRAHYADFNVNQAKMVVLSDDRFQYVSYRVKDQVYWTKRRLRIPKGELLLTDGESYARARCGNRLSDKPHKLAISPHEPDPLVLSLPPVTPEMLPKLALANPPALGALPGTAPFPETRTEAVPPPASFPIAGQPLVPVEPIWGGPPVPGGGVIPGPPLLPTNPTNPITPPTTPITPVTPPNGPQPPITPIPEPSTVYLFLISLAVSIWVLLRISQKNEAGK
jgi:hypothetical protein